jgi:hypothetical protein
MDRRSIQNETKSTINSFTDLEEGLIPKFLTTCMPSPSRTPHHQHAWQKDFAAFFHIIKKRGASTNFKAVTKLISV